MQAGGAEQQRAPTRVLPKASAPADACFGQDRMPFGKATDGVLSGF
eukprot:SAG31_NODE_213_length_20124_cov_17.709613_15_plen_46_part_00